MKLLQMIEGWRNNLFPPEALKEIIINVSSNRMNICKDCEFNSLNNKNRIKRMWDVFCHYILKTDEYCLDCSCPLAAKTKCLSCKCPKDKWDSIITEEEEIKFNLY